MSFFKVQTDEENVKDGGNSNYISSTGMYDVTIEAMWVETNDKGARVIGLLITYNDTLQPLFSAFRLDNNDGSANFEQQAFNKFLITLGIDELEEPAVADLPIGKGKTDKEVLVFNEVEDTPATLKVVMEYGKYNGRIQERKKIKGTYRYSDKATAQEIVNNAETGKQYEKDAEKLGDIYKDGVTEEEIQEWIKNGRNSNAISSAPSNTSDKPKRKFGKKE